MPYHLNQRIWLFLCVVLLSFPNVESLVFANEHNAWMNTREGVTWHLFQQMWQLLLTFFNTEIMVRVDGIEAFGSVLTLRPEVIAYT